MPDPVRIAVLGAGLIGRQHAERALATEGVALCGIVDPAEAGCSYAASKRVPWFPDLTGLLERERPDGVIVATPNQLHVEHGLQAIRAGLPALIEKPIADAVADAERLVDAAEQAGVALLTGHHRRHNPLIRSARQAIDEGRLGQITAAHAICWFHKPHSYFDAAWRREPGAGPVLINAIHDVDLLRFLCGEVTEVQAVASNARRGFAVEDTAAVLLRFASGALGTLSVSDTVSAPWSWELTSGENPVYSRTAEACMMIGGTLSSLAIPRLELWRHEGAPDWWRPIASERLPAQSGDPLALQMQNFRDVIRGVAAPVVSGRDGLETLRVIEAIRTAAATSQPVSVH